MLKQVESPVESPEVLLKSLDVQMQMTRSRREAGQKKRIVVLLMGLMLIVGGTTVALLALFSTIAGLPHGAVAQQEPVEQSAPR